MATKPNIMSEDDDLQPVSNEPEELVIVEDEPKKPESQDSEDDHDDKEDDRQLAKAGNDEEREVIRARRREERIERKERRDKAVSRDRLEMDFLRKRNDDLERRFQTIEQRQGNADLQNVDRQLKAAIDEVDMAEKVIAKAVEAGNGSDVTQAMRYRDQAIAKANQLNGIKQQAAQRQAPKAESMDDITLHYAKEFVKDHSWYDPQGRDEDSAVVLAIDQTLIRDGFSPQSEEYWTELRKRTTRRLPERFNVDKVEKSDRSARGGPAIGSGREHAPTSTRREVYISPDRKQALMDAGVWDDPTLRMKYVKRYSEYDKVNRS